MPEGLRIIVEDILRLITSLVAVSYGSPAGSIKSCWGHHS